MHGGHMIRSWSKMQNLVALPSAEADLNGIVRATAEVLACRSMAHDFGHFSVPGYMLMRVPP